MLVLWLLLVREGSGSSLLVPVSAVLGLGSPVTFPSVLYELMGSSGSLLTVAFRLFLASFYRR